MVADYDVVFGQRFEAGALARLDRRRIVHLKKPPNCPGCLSHRGAVLVAPTVLSRGEVGMTWKIRMPDCSMFSASSSERPQLAEFTCNGRRASTTIEVISRRKGRLRRLP